MPTETVVPVKLIGGLGSLVEQLDSAPAIVFPGGAVAGAGGIAVVVMVVVVSLAAVLLVVNVLVVVLLATVFGLGFIAIKQAKGTAVGRSAMIPFGPCLALALWKIYLFGPIIFDGLR